jgi:dTDP-4-amino-4,6-dideoxygalactose transaminase
LFLISIDFSKTKSTKDKLLLFLKNKNIIAQYHYIPLYKFSFCSKKINLVNAEYYYKNTFSLPIYYNLKIKSLIKIIKYINIFIKKNNLSI